MSNKKDRIALVVVTIISSSTLASTTAYAQNLQVQEYLFSVRQNLNIAIISYNSNCRLSKIYGNLDNGMSCEGARANLCQTALILSGPLEDLIAKRMLSPTNPTYRHVMLARSKTCG